MTAHCAPYMGAMKIFRTPGLRPRLFSQHFSWVFVPIDPVNTRTKFKVRIFTRSWVNALVFPRFLIGVSGGGCEPQSKGMGVEVRWWYLPKERWWVPIGPAYLLFLCQHVSARNFRSQFWVGVANPQSWKLGKERPFRFGNGTVRKSVSEIL